MHNFVPMLFLIPLLVLLHDFHFSRTDLVYSREGTWQVTVRVFTDDFEVELDRERERRGEEEGPIWLGDEREHPSCGRWAEAVAMDGWSLEVNGLEAPCAFLGYEVDYDVTYLYYESVATPVPDVLTVRNELFFGQFDDQVNEVHVEVNGTAKRELLTREMPIWTYKP